MSRPRRLDEMSWQDAEAAIGRSGIALIPVGAVEPHGRHAPLGADTYIAEAIATRLATRCEGVVFPPLPLGTLDLLYEFRHLPGSISIDPYLLTQVITNVGTELARHGVNRIVIVNGHGPNAAPLLMAAFEMRRRSSIQVGILDWWTAAGSVVTDIKGFRYGTHADEIETSILLATEGASLVRLSEATVNDPKLGALDETEKDLYILKIPFTRTLDERWVGSSGNMGDPTKADGERGDRILDETVRVGLRLLDVLALQGRLPGDGRTEG